MVSLMRVNRDKDQRGGHYYSVISLLPPPPAQLTNFRDFPLPGPA